MATLTKRDIIPLALTEDDKHFHARIQGSLRTVQAWDEDPTLFAECRALIPWAVLRDDSGEYSEPQDVLLSHNARFLQRFVRFFKASMTWVNNPVCSGCNSSDTKHKVTREPMTSEESEGGASRVEVYNCEACNSETLFPRHNSVRKLLETRQGRCGEYANLFGLFCRSLGLETRYILDWTDHVWTEVLLGEDWMMIDSCEGVINEPSMYEAGWGKELNCIVGVSIDHVMEVTPRYTRKWNDPDFQARRRAITSSDQASQMLVQQVNNTMQVSLSPKAKGELDRRVQREESLLNRCKQMTAWEHEYDRGRISGSLTWKTARHEAGKTNGESKDSKPSPERFHVEAFFPRVQQVSITVTPNPSSRHEGILVSGATCAVGQKDSLSVVVVDHEALGTILQSRAFDSLTSLAEFVDTLPEFRILAIQGHLENANADSKTSEKLAQLGGFDTTLVKDGILFIGQVQAKPDWAFCASFATAPEGHTTRAVGGEKGQQDVKLKTERNTRPASVVGRLPESIMPLQTQMLATDQQKRAAFLSLYEREKSWECYGYTTRTGLPVYLLGRTAYPFECVDSDQDAWNSFLLLPPALVPEDDKGIQDEVQSSSPLFEVPVDTNFFVQQIGPELLKKENGATTCVGTVAALSNTRLVGFYFSAHWCGPCRSFTPMLAEMYDHLKTEFPAHGLEIVFVSSDRDANSFQSYYGSMPWLSIPFDALGPYKQQLSMLYEVRGIPSLVVIDSISGQVVVPGSVSRREIMEACRRGEDAIEAMLKNWIDRVPTESKEMVAMLELSCAETDITNGSKEAAKNPYLVRTRGESRHPKDTATRVKEKFAELVQQGMTPNEAAAKAIELVSSQSQPELEPGPLNGKFESVTVPKQSDWEEVLARIVHSSERGKADIIKVCDTVTKYLENAQKAPWAVKYRSFKLSNKVADRITCIEGGLDFLKYLGFLIEGNTQDFIANIPLDSDFDSMMQKIKLWKELYGSA